MRTLGTNISLRDVTIAQMGNGAAECGWHHTLEACGVFGGFWKSQSVKLRAASGEDGWLLLARGGLATGFAWDGGCRWKSQNRKNVYLSPYVEESLNSKVIKSFVPELKSRKCFSCFKIPMFYVYMLWTFYECFTHSHIWLWYTKIKMDIIFNIYNFILASKTRKRDEIFKKMNNIQLCELCA